jgi:hypothetical protein
MFDYIEHQRFIEKTMFDRIEHRFPEHHFSRPEQHFSRTD